MMSQRGKASKLDNFLNRLRGLQCQEKIVVRHPQGDTPHRIIPYSEVTFDSCFDRVASHRDAVEGSMLDER